MSSAILWDGRVGIELFDDAQRAVRGQLADACGNADWEIALALLRKQPALVNTTRPGGNSLYAPLHQAACLGASADVIAELLGLGAWRTLENGQGDRAVDLAAQRGREDLVPHLTPAIAHPVPADTLGKIQDHFHDVIRERMRRIAIRLDALRLPALMPMLEVQDGVASFWFPVPGMHGGFEYQLRADAGECVLVSRSWSRVVEGSGQEHIITPHGSRLVQEGFV
jgi:hypothetical protein